MKKWIYEILYRFPFVSIDWIFGSSAQIETFLKLAIDGRIMPGRAITLGCGVGREAIYLAKMGFDVIGVDFSPTAIKRAGKNARAAGVPVTFVEDDLTNLQRVSGIFELIVDIGALTDLKQESRDLYIKSILPLTHPGTKVLLVCFENQLPTKEVERRFGEFFSIDRINKMTEEGWISREIALYLMIKT
jgi:cyclopropane fatty-acyl-phospholipid synthase-like methyltransferase